MWESGLRISTIERSDGDSRNDQRVNDDDEPRLARKTPFRGFTDGSQEDIELLSAIGQYTPYDAQYRKKQEAWSFVVSYLKGERTPSPLHESMRRSM